MKSILRNLVLVVSSCFATFLLAEVVLRYSAHRVVGAGEWLEVGSVFEKDDPVTGFSLKPGATRLTVKGGDYVVRDSISRQGLRDVEHAIPKPAGRRRALFLGDSFVYGDGVAMEQTLPRRLAQKLPGLEVVNAGVRAWNLDQYYLWYGARGARFEPDIVLVGFFINDLTRDRGYEIAVDPEGLPLAYYPAPDEIERRRGEEPRGFTGTVSSWFWSRSTLYALVRDRVDPLWQGARRGPVPRDTTGPPRPAYLPIFLAEGRDEPIRQAWSRAWQVLDALRRQVEQGGARFAVVMIPAPWQMSEKDWSWWLEWLQVDPADYGRRRPQEVLGSWCEATRTTCLDLLDTFQGRERDRLYYVHDFHWTEAGHDLAAEAVKELVAEMM